MIHFSISKSDIYYEKYLFGFDEVRHYVALHHLTDLMLGLREEAAVSQALGSPQCYCDSSNPYNDILRVQIKANVAMMWRYRSEEVLVCLGHIGGDGR